MGSGWPDQIALIQDASSLTVEFTYFHPRDVQPPIRLKYEFDGHETLNAVNLGRGMQIQRSRAHWSDRKLVIQTSHDFVNPQNGTTMTAEMTQTLLLVSPSKLLIETTRSAVLGGDASTTAAVYAR